MGVHRDTGKWVEGLDELSQSAGEVISTPLRTRPFEPEYGTDLAPLVDLPINRTGRARFAAATIDALGRWETRVDPTKATITADADGEVLIDVALSTQVGDTHAATVVADDGPAAMNLNPAGLFVGGDYSADDETWVPTLGAGVLGAPSLVPSGSDGYPLFDDAGESLESGVLSISTEADWTVAVMVVPFAGGSGPLVGVCEDGEAEPWAELRDLSDVRLRAYASGLPVVDEAVGTVAALELGVLWLWLDGQRIGASLDGEGAAYLPTSPLAADPSRIVLGGSSAPFIASHLSHWPRALTRRERLGVSAHWKRQA
jgi:phage baseplate assembly protein W